MTKLKMAMAAGVAAVLAFGVAACGQTTAQPEATDTAPAADTATTPEAPAPDAAPTGEPSSTPPAGETAPTTPPSQ